MTQQTEQPAIVRPLVISLTFTVTDTVHGHDNSDADGANPVDWRKDMEITAGQVAERYRVLVAKALEGQRVESVTASFEIVETPQP